MMPSTYTKARNLLYTGYVCEPRPNRADEYTSADPSDPLLPYDVNFCGDDEDTYIYCYNGGSCQRNRISRGVYEYYCECTDDFVGDDCSIR